MNRYWILGLILLSLPFALGCPTSTPTSPPADQGGEAPPAAQVAPDDPEAVATLESLGGKLTKDSNGNVIRADMSAVVVSDDSVFAPLAELKQLQLVKFYGAEITDNVTTYLKELTNL